MGEVYRVRDIRLKRNVALKILPVRASTRSSIQNGRQNMKAALSCGLIASIVLATFPANAQEMNRASSEVLSPDSTATTPPIVAAPDAAGSDEDARVWTLSESAVTPSLRMFVARDISPVQQAPPKPRNLNPSLPLKPGSCSKAKGAAIGAGIGGGVGFVAGATAKISGDLGPGRMYAALVFGAVGAGVGAVIGLLRCR
jgi:hypothetical protein